ncbi:MAG: YibE/F family protein [Patescibacteria group bacterium]|jgi:uncharacterized membrane protein
MFKKIIFLFLILSFFNLFTPIVKAATEASYFKARVIKILQENKKVSDNREFTQQNLLLEALTGELKGQQIEYRGISDIEVVDVVAYKAGELVWVSESTGANDEKIFTITDSVRSGKLLWLTLFFCLLVVIIGGFKGFKSLLSLLLSFIVIIKLLIPNILAGGNPVFWGVVGAFLIMLAIIYLTDGFNRRSHLAVLSITIVLVIIYSLSFVFSDWLRLSGLAEEASFLIALGLGNIDFRGLLLAGFVIGAVGVLDDIVVGQIESVRQLKLTDKTTPKYQLFTSAYQVGKAHLGAIINTLFLTYAGSSLLLLILFSVGQEPFLSFSRVIDNEMIATEIARTLVGSIGVVLSLPIATGLAVFLLKEK